jgi:MarR family transcriptional regulator, lower aerobic nicotinate degradation pathway regulator
MEDDGGMSMGETEVATLSLPDAPGHLIRRAQRVHAAFWAEAVGPQPTGPQFALLTALASHGEIDQTTAGLLTSLDKSSTADIVRRLSRDRWIEIGSDPADRRRKLLSVTQPARSALVSLTDRAREVQQRLLAPLPGDAAEAFVRRLAVVAYEGDPPTEPAAPSRIGLPLATTPGHLIRRAQQAYTARWTETFGTGLTGPQYAVLCVVAQAGSVDQGSVGELASLDKSSVAEVVDRLVDRDLLGIGPDVGDRRRKTVRLTGAAVAQLPDLTERARGVQQALLDLVPTDEQQLLMRDLRLVAYR